MNPSSTAIRPKEPVSSAGDTSHTSWGRYPRVSHQSIFRANWADEVFPILQGATCSLLPYGLGRSYGDSCLNDGGALLDCSGLKRLLGADFREGWIRCEGGATLGDLLEIIVPRGWFLPVTPGTRFVTIGGAIANDVHGKNHHHAGTFGCHVRALALSRSDTEIVICSPMRNADLFAATIGGLGLTGVILWAEIQLKPIQASAIDVDAFHFTSLEQFLTLTEQSDRDYEYTVAWADSVSRRATRGIFFRGNHSVSKNLLPRKLLQPGIPFDLPGWMLSGPAVKAFNSGYFHSNRLRSGRKQVPYETFFYPLDSVRNWNRIYGKRGFLQYQFVVPDSASQVFEEMLALIARSGMGSFLAVLKKFGSRKSPGLLSFPRPGLTLALDFPMRGEKTLALLDRLDAVLMKAGGALYPAKDSRMSPAMFEASFPNWRDLRPYLDGKLSSSLWRRVSGRVA